MHVILEIVAASLEHATPEIADGPAWANRTDSHGDTMLLLTRAGTYRKQAKVSLRARHARRLAQQAEHVRGMIELVADIQDGAIKDPDQFELPAVSLPSRFGRNLKDLK